MWTDRLSARSLTNVLKDEADADSSPAYGPAASLSWSGDRPKSTLLDHALKNSAAVSKGPPRPGMGPCRYEPSSFIPQIVPILGSFILDRSTCDVQKSIKIAFTFTFTFISKVRGFLSA